MSKKKLEFILFSHIADVIVLYSRFSFVYNQKVEEKSKEVYAHRGELGNENVTGEEKKRRSEGKEEERKPKEKERRREETTQVNTKEASGSTIMTKKQQHPLQKTSITK
jgi:hypothetical protein